MAEKKVPKKTRWQNFNTIPVTPGWEKTNILLSTLVAVTSVILSIVALRQTAEIDALKDLINSGKPSVRIISPRINQDGDSLNYIVQIKNFGGRSAMEVQELTYLINNIDHEINVFGDSYQNSVDLSAGQHIDVVHPLKRGLYGMGLIKTAYMVCILKSRDPLTSLVETVVEYGQNGVDMNGKFTFRKLRPDEVQTVRVIFSKAGNPLP